MSSLILLLVHAWIAGSSQEPLVAEPDPRGVLTGTLVSAEGEPLPGTVIWGDPGSGTVQVESEESGAFRFDEAPPRCQEGVLLTVRSPGYQPLFFDHLKGTPLGHRSVGELTLQRGKTLQGRVVDEQGRPIHGATIELYDSFDQLQDSRSWFEHPPLHVAVSDDDGTYRIEGVGEFRHLRRTVAPPSFCPLVEVSAWPGEFTSTTLARGRSLRILARDEQNRPLSGVHLTYRQNSAHSLERVSGVTDSHGVAWLQGVSSNAGVLDGTMRPLDGWNPESLIVEPWNDERSKAEARGEWHVLPRVPVVAEQSMIDLIARPPKGGVVCQVQDAKTREPIPFVTILGIPDVDDSVRESPFFLRWWSEHRCSLRASSPGYVPTKIEPPGEDRFRRERRVIRLQRTPETQEAPTPLASHGTIEGVVRSKEGRPVAGALVRFRDEATTTDAKGRFDLPGPPGRDGCLWIDGGIHGFMSIRCAAPASKELELCVPSWGTLKGRRSQGGPAYEFHRSASNESSYPSVRLRGSVRINGEPAARRTVRIYRQVRSGEFWTSWRSCVTDARGQYELLLGPNARLDSYFPSRDLRESYLVVDALPASEGPHGDQVHGVARVAQDLPIRGELVRDLILETAKVRIRLNDAQCNPTVFTPLMFERGDFDTPIRPRPRHLWGANDEFTPQSDYTFELATGQYLLVVWSDGQGHLIRELEVVGRTAIDLDFTLAEPRTVEILAPEGAEYGGLMDPWGNHLPSTMVRGRPSLGNEESVEGATVFRIRPLQESPYLAAIWMNEEEAWRPDCERRQLFEVTADSPQVIRLDLR